MMISAGSASKTQGQDKCRKLSAMEHTEKHLESFRQEMLSELQKELLSFDKRSVGDFADILQAGSYTRATNQHFSMEEPFFFY